MKVKRINKTSLLLKGLVYLSAGIVFLTLISLLLYVLVKGIPNLSPRQFAFKYTADNVSMTPAIVNTVIMTFVSLVIAVPLGVSSAIYLVEYAKRGNKLVSVIRLTTETLSGIPSIVYGLFGYLMFVITCGFGYSMLGGALTLCIMVLPLIMRTTEEALKSVPDMFREGSFWLGAGNLRTIVTIVLPAAVPGILAGVVLAVGRILGETVALIYTPGTVAGIPKNLLSSGRTLSVHMYSLLSEGLHTREAYASAVILLIVVVAINGLSGVIARSVSSENI